MQEILQFSLLGLAEGALIAALALGVVACYRGANVVNFATGAVAMYASYVYTFLRANGDYFVPPLPNPLSLLEKVLDSFGAQTDLPDFPAHVHLSDPMGAVPAAAIALLTSALIGWVSHLLVFRPLRTAPALAKVVASVGVMLTLQAVVVLRFGSTLAPQVPSVLPSDAVDLFGTRVGVDQLLLAAIVVLAALGLAAVYRFTRFGLATRAAASNEKGAMLLGYSTDQQAAINWVVAATIAGGVGILVRGLVPLDATLLPLLIVPALAAALLGGLNSFTLATLAGLGIGVSRSVISYFETLDWWPESHGEPVPGVRQALPLALIILVMVWRGRRLPTRGATVETNVPFAPRPEGVAQRATVAVALVVVALLTLGPGWRGAILNTLTGAILALSLVVLTGFLGQISLAQMSFAGVAGFALSKVAQDLGVPFPVAPVLAALVATAVGVAVAVPALRIRGVNLAIVTLASAVAIQQVVFENKSVTGGPAGSEIPSPSLAGVDFGPNDHFLAGDDKIPTAGFGLALVVVVLLLSLAVVNLRRSPTGRHMLAVRSNERAAAAAGVNVARTKVQGFAISSFIAGIGGAMIGYKFGTLTSGSFGVFASLTVLAFAYLGGITSVSGAMIAGLLAADGVGFHATDQLVGIDARYQFLVAGLGLILMAVLNPNGIAGATRVMVDGLRQRLRHKPQPVPPEASGENKTLSGSGAGRA